MLFSSYVFVLAFLPLAVLAFRLLDRQSRRAALAVLLLFSLFYYGYWNVRYVPLLLASILANYGLGGAIRRAAARGQGRVLLALGIAANLALLGYFKYAHFLVGMAAPLLDAKLDLGTIVLPLAISFYTFQQIAYLVDSYRGNVGEEGLLPYAVFVTFFPHLIAGPILHHREMMPQFAGHDARRPILEDLSVGVTVFVIGLSKKILIADPMGGHATPTFDAAAAGVQPDFYSAWIAALSYTFQLYFDFSGYSDMAVGAARMLGIRLPANFFSPYRAPNIIEFWRRWHMTLSRLLRDYLYVPLGGNRKGMARRYINLLTTMLLGGLWHGAGWTFVVWGALHGIYLTINHAWRAARMRMGWTQSSRAGAVAARCLTFLAVVVAWVVFRADDLATAARMLAAMSGMEGVSVPARTLAAETAAAWGVAVSAMPARPLLLCALLLALVWTAPNSYELTRRFDPVLLPRGFAAEPPAAFPRLAWRPSPAWALPVSVALAGALLGMLSDRIEFLYYQF